MPERHLAVSRDGGATWLQGASPGPTARAHRAFAGPQPGTLYVLGTTLSVSLDGGLSLAASHPVNGADQFILGNGPPPRHSGSARPSALYSNDAAASFRTITFPTPARWVVVDPTDTNHLVASGADETAQSWDGGVT